MSVFSSILTICLIVFSSFLVTKTLQIQHSCQPMIHWSGDFSAECQVANKDEFERRDREKMLLRETAENKPGNNNLPSTKKSENTKAYSNSQLEQTADNSLIADLDNTFNPTKTEAKAQINLAEKLEKEEKELLQVDRDESNSQSNKSERNSQLSAAKVALNDAENNSQTQLDAIIEIAKENAGKVAVTAGVVTGAVAIATGMPIALAAIAVAGAGAAVWQSIKSFLH